MIEVAGLSKKYGTSVAVDALSFSVKPGVVTGFLGPNGAGKSTTMRMILGLDRPDSGEVRICGKPYRELAEPMRIVGALLDAAWGRPEFSARTHLRWVASFNGLSPQRADELLGWVGLESVAGKRIGGFSLGMRQRLGIAMALLGDPEVLLFDEPMNGLDPEGVAWIRQSLRTFAEEGRTLLVSSHLLSEMALTADEVVVIGAGRLIAQSSITDFIHRSAEASVTVRTPDTERFREALKLAGLTVTRALDGALKVTGTSAAKVGELAADNGVVVHELRSDQGSLEEAFLRMTGEFAEYRALAPSADRGGSR